MSVLRVLLFASLALFAVLAIGIWYLTHKIAEFTVPSAGAAPVHFLQDLPDGEIAVMLHPMLTGKDPMLVRDQATLSAAAETAYVIDKETGSEILGTVVMAMMGANNSIPVLTVYVDRVPVREIFCNLNQCTSDGWIDDAFHHDLAGLENAGLRVRRSGEIFRNHDAYVAAQAAALANPDIYFDHSAQAELDTDDLSRPNYELRLPSRMVPYGQTDISAEIAHVSRVITPALSDLEIAPLSLDVRRERGPRLVLADLTPVMAEDGTAFRLWDQELLTPYLTFVLSETQATQLANAVPYLPVNAADQTAFDAAIDEALDAQSLHMCRPDCRIDPAAQTTGVELIRLPPQTWNMIVWEVTP